MHQRRLASLDEKTANNSIEFSGLQGSALSYALAQVYAQCRRPLLLIVPTHKEALSLGEELGFFLGQEKDVHIFPPLGILPYYGLSPNVDVVAHRMAFLEQMRHRKEPWIGILSLSSLMRRLPDPALWDRHSEYLVVGEEVDRESLLKNLINAGYLNAPIVEDPGTFSRRGGILDLYSPQGPNPVRLEFFGDQLESMRTFDPESQRSLGEVEEIMILPAREVLFSDEYRKRAQHRFKEQANEKGLASEIREPFLESLKNEMMPPSLETYLPLFYPDLKDIFAYLPSQFVGIWIEPDLGKEHFDEILQEVDLGYQSCESPEKVVSPKELFLTWEEIEKGLEGNFPWRGRLLETESTTHLFKTEGHEELSVRLRHAPLGEEMLKPLVDRMGQWIEQGFKIGLVASSHSQSLRLEDLLVRQGLSVQKTSQGFPQFLNQETQSKRKIFLIEGHLAKGFVWPEEGLTLLTDQEIFGEKKRRRSVGRRTTETFTTFEELGEGDFVIHEEHGLGLYHGLKSLDLDGQKNDFLLLEYMGGDKLYVPVYRL
ncbi:MAG: CarD family transcriptional regulator, partial [bacterium]|nr:CarD family transcriptional regulator [bacterium]